MVAVAVLLVLAGSSGVRARAGRKYGSAPARTGAAALLPFILFAAIIVARTG